MSSHHVAALSHVQMPQARKLVLLCLADDAGAQTGVAVPGLEELMAWSCLGKSAVLAHLAALAEGGYIQRLSGGHSGHRAEFRVLCPCPEHNGSTTQDPKGSQPQDPTDREGSRKGPGRVQELVDPLNPSSLPSPSQRATRLAASWGPSDADQDYAAGLGFTPPQIHRMAEDFRDYWTAKAGRDGTKLDWAATWRTWVRREADRRPQARPEQQPRTASTFEQERAAAERRAQREREAAAAYIAADPEVLA